MVSRVCYTITHCVYFGRSRGGFDPLVSGVKGPQHYHTLRFKSKVAFACLSTLIVPKHGLYSTDIFYKYQAIIKLFTL